MITVLYQQIISVAAVNGYIYKDAVYPVEFIPATIDRKNYSSIAAYNFAKYTQQKTF